MKFSASREQLLPAVQAASRLAPARAVHPVYSHLQMALDGSTLSILSGDGDATVQVRLPVNKEAAGQMLLPAQTLGSICQTAPPGSEIAFSLKDGKASIQVEKSRFSLAVLEDEFPAPEAVDGTVIEIPADRLHWLLEKTFCCMAVTDFRNYLMGTLLHLDAQGLHVVATDTHRLALAQWKDGKHPDGESIQAIVPRRSVSELIRLLERALGKEEEDEAEGEDKPEKAKKSPAVKVTLGEQQVRFDVGNASLQSSLIRGRYPEYGRVIPDHSKGTVLEMDSESVRRSLKRAAVVLDRGGTVDWKLKADQVQLQSENEKGDKTDQQLAATYAGDKEVAIRFNISYQTDIMENMDSEKFHMMLFAESESVSLLDPQQSDLCYVLMPLRQ